MPVPHNATVSYPEGSYADFVPPYPFDFDFEPDLALPPTYASLNYSAPEAGTAWQPSDDALQPLGDAAGEPVRQDAGPCATDLVCTVAVGMQLAGVLALLYGSLSGYSPFGLH